VIGDRGGVTARPRVWWARVEGGPMGSGAADGESPPLAATVAAEVVGLPIEVTAHGRTGLTARCAVPEGGGDGEGSGSVPAGPRRMFEVALQAELGEGVPGAGVHAGGVIRVTRLEPDGFYDAGEFGGLRSACENGMVEPGQFLRGWCRYCVAASDRGEVFEWLRGRYPRKGDIADTRSALVLMPAISSVLAGDEQMPGGGYFELELRWRVTVDADTGEVGHDLNLVPSASPDVWAEDVEGVLASLDEEFPGLVELQGPKCAVVTIMDSLDPIASEEEGEDVEEVEVEEKGEEDGVAAAASGVDRGA